MDVGEPTGIRIDRESRTLSLSWTGLPDTVVDWTTLRLACPCAQCQGEFRSQGLDVVAIRGNAAELDLVDVVIIGRYALQPEWRSGHGTGIYTWEYLREIGEERPDFKPAG
jgi:DUF971 family protein